MKITVTLSQEETIRWEGISSPGYKREVYDKMRHLKDRAQISCYYGDISVPVELYNYHNVLLEKF